MNHEKSENGNMGSKISRRSFIVGAGSAVIAAVGASMIGCSATSVSEGTSESPNQPTQQPAQQATQEPVSAEASVWTVEEVGEPTETIEAQVCILGGGGSGLAAGISARQLGLDAVVLEKSGHTGGSFIGTEGLFAVGSHWQKEAGETFTASEVIAKCMDFHHWIPSTEMYREFFDMSADSVDWLESIGVEFDHVQTLGTSYNCWHIYKGSTHPGIEFMQSMLEAAENVNLRMEMSIAGRKLLLDASGKVEGVLALRDDGTVVKVVAPVVILACGGYSNNLELLSYLAEAEKDLLLPCGQFGLEGDGIKAGKDIGAALARFPGTSLFYGPAPRGSNWQTMATACTLQPIIWVNQDAKRFCREDMFLKDFSFAGQACIKQKKVYAIANQEMIDRFETGSGALVSVGVYVLEGENMPGLSDEIEGLKSLGGAYVADSIEELAPQLGLDTAALKETVDRYNEMCNAGADDEFLKEPKDLFAISKGPFYGFDCQVGYFATVGGLKVTSKTEVLTESDEIIPGLYAVGCDTGGFFGDTYDVGIAAGSAAGWAISSGRIAAKETAEYLKA